MKGKIRTTKARRLIWPATALLLVVLLFIVHNKSLMEDPREPKVGARNIFLVEATCATKLTEEAANPIPAGTVRLTERQACAIEAAAKTNPDRPVFLVHTCPLSDDRQSRESWPSYALEALSLPNVRVWPLSFWKAMSYVSEGVREAARFLDHSSWPERDAEHLVRFMLLERYGGTALDSYCILVRSLENISNFAAAESKTKLSTLAMDFSWDYYGRKAAKKCAERMDSFIATHSRMWDWTWFFTAAIESMCETRGRHFVNHWKCLNFKLFPESAFYPVAKDDWKKYFNLATEVETMRAVNSSVGVHVGKDVVNVAYLRTKQPLAQIAKRVCPRVVAKLIHTI